MLVMVCYDGSERARAALEKTVDLFSKTKPEILILTVTEPPLDATSTDESSFEKWKETKEEELGEAAEWVASSGIITDAVLAVGDPRKMIVEAAEKKKPDLLVIARRGTMGHDKVTVGSICAYVVKYATCPVVVY
ncbi:MAG: universal stress protein [Thermodesulfobacteriota bacterium]